MEKATPLKDRIIEDSPGWLILDKPPGLETIVKGGGNTKYCLTSKLRRELGIKGIAPVHRLDRDTTGCLLFAKEPELVKPLENLFRKNEIFKEYLGLCLGIFTNPTGSIRRRLSKWTGGRQAVQVVKGQGGLEAETEYEVLAVAEARNSSQTMLKLLSNPALKGGVSLARFVLHTGRTHQIRVHVSSLGRPILGDDQYGDRAANKLIKTAFRLSRQALHAWKLSFPDPVSGKTIQVEAPVPEDMQAILDGLFRNLKI
ncbi:MAG: RluA family pseudouridine synthase [Planctomycetes bacterium]|nr:RluA family pseudouridine synthase [Planctomycetota bacterium]